MNRIFLIISLSVIGCASLLFAISPRIHLVKSKLERSGAIIVLGGESGERIFKTAELYASRFAPLVIVTGNGNCEGRRQRLILAKVQEGTILVDCKSRNTAENAMYSVRLLRSRGINKAIIVTSWWHTARAVHCFKHYAPEIQFLAAPAFNGSNESSPAISEVVMIMNEYVKRIYYAAVYKII